MFDVMKTIVKGRYRRGCQSGYRSGDLWNYDSPVLEVSSLGPGCQSGYRSGDL